MNMYNQGGRLRRYGCYGLFLMFFFVLLVAVPVAGQETNDGQPAPVDVLRDIADTKGTATGGFAGGEAPAVDLDNEFAEENDEWLEDENFTDVVVSDPLEPINRVFFHFNDKLYFWVLKPLAVGFRFVVPKPVRKGLANVFYNLGTPVRLVNCLLQGKLKSSGKELTRFVINSTVGVVGLWDPARDWFDLKPKDEDFGQTLGKYGIGEGVYLCLPVFGPSNIRDGVGRAGDYFLDPLSWATLTGDRAARDAALAGDTTRRVNKVSLRIGDYENFKKATFDPYSAMRDAYSQQRRSKVKD